MSEKRTIESLISTSGEEDWEGLPLFFEGKIIKRISKEEIQGWNQGQQRQPFQKKETHSRKTKRSTVKVKQPSAPESFERECFSPPPSLKTIKTKLNDYDNNNIFQAFRTVNYLPAPSEELVLPKLKSREEPKQDFVKGIKFVNCIATPKKTTPLKPLFKAFSQQSKKSERPRCKSISERSKNVSKKSQSGSEKQVSIISYPMDVKILGEGESLSYNKLHCYMRKYQLDKFQP